MHRENVEYRNERRRRERVERETGQALKAGEEKTAETSAAIFDDDISLPSSFLLPSPYTKPADALSLRVRRLLGGGRMENKNRLVRKRYLIGHVESMTAVVGMVNLMTRLLLLLLLLLMVMEVVVVVVMLRLERMRRRGHQFRILQREKTTTTGKCVRLDPTIPRHVLEIDIYKTLLSLSIRLMRSTFESFPV